MTTQEKKNSSLRSLKKAGIIIAIIDLVSNEIGKVNMK